MAQQQQHHTSDGSSTTSSHILFTPSETVITPSATLLDVAQQSRENLASSNSPLSELGVSDDDLPVDLDNNHMPDLSFQQRCGNEDRHQQVDYQNVWTANDDEYNSIQYAGESKARIVPILLISSSQDPT